MTKHQIKTDNSFLSEKRHLRAIALRNFPNGAKVLDCYSGDGNMYAGIDKKHKITPIEVKSKSRTYLKGDNIKFLLNMNLENFDIIDLDAYGIPFKQLETIFKSKFSGIVIVTYIQSGMGILPSKLLEACGYSKKMIKKCPTLLSKKGLDNICMYLENNNIKNIKGYFFGRKNYFMFEIKKEA